VQQKEGLLRAARLNKNEVPMSGLDGLTDKQTYQLVAELETNSWVG
jgi:hypothetical protein